MPLFVSQPQKARRNGQFSFPNFFVEQSEKTLRNGFSVSEELAYLRIIFLDLLKKKEKVRFGHTIDINLEIEEGAESLQTSPPIAHPAFIGKMRIK